MLAWIQSIHKLSYVQRLQVMSLYGIDVLNKKIADMTSKNVYDPLAVKEHILNGATEVACMILRIDNIIAGSKSKDMPSGLGAGGGHAMPGGYGGGGYGAD